MPRERGKNLDWGEEVSENENFETFIQEAEGNQHTEDDEIDRIDP